MPSKYYQRQFVPNYHYHLYNRGAHKQDIYLEEADYATFTDIMVYYLNFPQGKPRSYLERYKNDPNIKVPNLDTESPDSSFHVVAYCLMPNHFHFMIKQVAPPAAYNSPINFMRRVSITYALYYNEKYEHSGTLFQGKYKNILVESEPQLIYLTKYIHRNPLSFLPKPKLATYPHSSYAHYLDKTHYDWIRSSEILDFFSKKHPQLDYQHFIEEIIDDNIDLENLTLEN